MEIVPTKLDIEHAKKLVEVRKSKGRGMGVFALTEIPEMTFIGPYPGRVYSDAAYDEAKKMKLTTGEYGLDFWMPRPVARNTAVVAGRPNRQVRARRPNIGYTYEYDDGWVIDPADGKGNIMPRFINAVAPYINEPGRQEQSNMYWVYNIPRHRVEFWTSEKIKKGDELLLCYGTTYDRSYETSCNSKNNPQYALHFIYDDDSSESPLPLSNNNRRNAVQNFGLKLQNEGKEAALQQYMRLIKAKNHAANFLRLYNIRTIGTPTLPPPSQGTTRAKRLRPSVNAARPRPSVNAAVRARPVSTKNSTNSILRMTNNNNNNNNNRPQKRRSTQPIPRSPPGSRARRPSPIPTPALNAAGPRVFREAEASPRNNIARRNTVMPNVTLQQTRWLKAMHRILDKPTVSNADVAEVHRLVAVRPVFKFNRNPMPALEHFNEPMPALENFRQ